MPKSELSGEVTRYAEGLVHVATRDGIQAFPAAPGLTPTEGQRVVIRNNMVTGIIGAAQDVPTFYV
jgi:hypothetical protein